MTDSRPLAVVLASGGLDSTTLAFLLRRDGYRLRLVSCHYGQRHAKELSAARRMARWLEAEYDQIDLTTVGARLRGSALTDASVPVPHGHYEAESMQQTIVPNRNAILLAVAFGIAVAEGATTVATAVHAGDHAIYPDCRPSFITAFDYMEQNAIGDGAPRLLAPFLYQRKFHIVQIGADLGVPFAETWSCYEGKQLQCGQCGTCVERREAFALAGVHDPTQYAIDPEESR